MGGLRSMSKFAALCAVLAALAACTQVDKAAAIKLADAGKVAATNGAAEAAAARADFVASGERNVASDLLDQADVLTEATQKTFETFDLTAYKKRLEIAAIMRLREEALTSLAATYAEMSALASGDPGANVRRASADLIGKTNGLAAALNAAAPWLPIIPVITKTVGAVFGEAAALYAEERQRREILATSEIIRAAVGVLQKAIENERRYSDSIRQENARARATLADSALNFGMIDQSAAILRIAELAEFTAIKDPNTIVAGASSVGTATEDQKRRQRLVWALWGFEKFRASLKAAAIKDASDTLESALAKLVAGHAKLDERKPFDVDDALAMALKVKEAVERIRAAEATK